VTHHTHSVKGGLTVEKHIVTVLEASLHDHSVVQVFLDLVGIMQLDEVDHILIVSLLVVGLNQVFDFSLLT
jgi:hypothetical protein